LGRNYRSATSLLSWQPARLDGRRRPARHGRIRARRCRCHAAQPAATHAHRRAPLYALDYLHRRGLGLTPAALTGKDLAIPGRVATILDFAEFTKYRNMANTAQARKRARQSVERNKHNSSLRSMLRTAIKRVRQSIAAGDKAAASEVFQKATSVIDRVADKN